MFAKVTDFCKHLIKARRGGNPYRGYLSILPYSTHGEMAGIPSSLIKRMRETMFEERAFLSRLHLNILDQKVWMKAVYDPLAGSLTYGYLPKFALA